MVDGVTVGGVAVGPVAPAGWTAGPAHTAGTWCPVAARGGGAVVVLPVVADDGAAVDVWLVDVHTQTGTPAVPSRVTMIAPGRLADVLAGPSGCDRTAVVDNVVLSIGRVVTRPHVFITTSPDSNEAVATPADMTARVLARSRGEGLRRCLLRGVLRGMVVLSVDCYGRTRQLDICHGAHAERALVSIDTVIDSSTERA